MWSWLTGGRVYSSKGKSPSYRSYPHATDFFWSWEFWNFFLEFKDFKRRLRQFLLAKQSGPAIKASAFEYFLDCAMDATCQLRCASTGGVNTAYRVRGACVYQRDPPKAINVGRPTHDD